MSNEIVVPEALTVKKLQTTVLGQKGLIRLDERGLLASEEVDFEVSYKKGHYYNMPQKVKDSNGQWQEKNNFRMLAEGYEAINRIVGLQQVDEPTMIIAGKEYSNPHVFIDEQGKKEKVWVKVTLVGRGPDGVIAHSTCIIMYDAKDALVSSIISKAKYDGDKYAQLCTTMGFEQLIKTNPNLAFYPIDEIMGIALNLSNKDALATYQKYQEDKNIIERKASTIARRNAFRRHPATAYYTVSPHKKMVGDKVVDSVDNVKLVRWFNYNDDEIQEYIKNNILGKDTDPSNVMKYQDTDTSDADDSIIEEEIVDDEFTVDDFVVLEEDEETLKLIDWIDNSKVAFGEEDVDAIVDKICQGRTLNDISKEEVKVLKNKINSLQEAE